MTLSKERLEQLVARSSDVVVATSRTGEVIYTNSGAQRILGYSPDELDGRFVGELYPSVAEAKRVKQAMASRDHGGPDIVDTFETTFLAKSGEEIPVAISGTLLRDEHGEVDGTIGFAKDLREILANDQLATLGEVAIGLSHEINNPLSVVLNQTEMLEKDLARLVGDRDVSVEFERLDSMRREIGRISEIVERLSEMVEQEQYSTIQYIGPAKMIDLRRRWESVGDEILDGLQVLVADDDPGICQTLKEILQAEGCAVETAADGAEALAKVSLRRFDVVLSDVVMPNMDGHELFMAIRRQQPELPVLLMTAFHYDRGHVIKRSKLEGLEGVVFKKPVDAKRLCQVIGDTVRSRDARDASRAESSSGCRGQRDTHDA
ncbi:MAG: response regulator [Deltaproteobacteria bacterium]|nr:response regulator [Deltaproteobacteria bacterium]MBW2362986.1 response regulator [Deltaproteobacteria bacterium]